MCTADTLGAVVGHAVIGHARCGGAVVSGALQGVEPTSRIWRTPECAETIMAANVVELIITTFQPFSILFIT
jgi:pyrimidine deaminase RibD-like protein